MAKIKQGNFIEIDFTGRIKFNGRVFDTSKEDVAKENGIYNPNMKYSPLIICVGQRQVISGLEKGLIDKELGKKYEIVVKSEEGYGKRDNRLIRMVPIATFTKNKLNPYPGLQVNADGMIGIVKSVSGGRIMVDFNHFLAGRDLVFEIEIIKIVDDVNEKVKNIIGYNLFLKESMYKFRVEKEKLILETERELPDFLRKHFETKLKDVVSEIKEVEFIKINRGNEKKEVATQA